MKHVVDVAERIPGSYQHVAPILRLDFDYVVKAALDELRLEIGGSTVSRRVAADVGAMEIRPEGLRVPLRWDAAEHPKAFPAMDGELRIVDGGNGEIELRLVGEYQPPLGPLGAVGDAVAGRYIASQSLHQLLAKIARRLHAKFVEHDRSTPGGGGA